MANKVVYGIEGSRWIDAHGDVLIASILNKTKHLLLDTKLSFLKGYALIVLTSVTCSSIPIVGFISNKAYYTSL